MAFIDGETLYKCWDKLGRFMQFRIACTPRLYCKQLGSLTRSAPGPFNGLVSGVLFDEYKYGPFDSVRLFARFCEYVAFQGWKARVRGAIGLGNVIPALPHPNRIWTLVFTHGDLKMSRIMLDRRGGLWVMDWENACFYPPSMESIVMRHMDEIVHAQDVSPSWRRYRSLIAWRTSREEEEFWDNFAGSIHRFPGKPQCM